MSKESANYAAKAPAGGLTSHVNGQRYEGGQFVPLHGQFCGKGRNRCTKARFDEVAAKAKARGWELRYNESQGLFQFVLSTGNVLMSARGLEFLAKAL